MANYINGKLYPNGNINIRNNKVYIDGVLQSGSVTVEGSVTGDIKTTNVDVKCGFVGSNIKTVNGNVSKF